MRVLKIFFPLMFCVLGAEVRSQAMEEVIVYGESINESFDWTAFTLWTAANYSVNSFSDIEIDQIDSNAAYWDCKNQADDAVDHCVNTYSGTGRYLCFAAGALSTRTGIKFLNRFIDPILFNEAFTTVGGLATYGGCTSLTNEAVEWCENVLWLQDMETCMGTRD